MRFVIARFLLSLVTLFAGRLKLELAGRCRDCGGSAKRLLDCTQAMDDILKEAAK